MIRTVVVAIATTIVMSSAASACGFFDKIKYGGFCSEDEYIADQLNDITWNDDVAVVKGNYIHLNVDGVVSTIKTSELKNKSEAQIKEIVGEAVFASMAEDQGLSIDEIMDAAGNLDHDKISGALVSAEAHEAIQAAQTKAVDAAAAHDAMAGCDPTGASCIAAGSAGGPIPAN